MPGLPEMECVIMAQYPGKKRPCHTHIKYKSRSSGRLHSRIEIFMALQDFKPEKKCELEWAQKWIFLLDVHFYAQNLCMTVLPHHIQVKYRIAFFFCCKITSFHHKCSPIYLWCWFLLMYLFFSLIHQQMCDSPFKQKFFFQR